MKKNILVLATLFCMAFLLNSCQKDKLIQTEGTANIPLPSNETAGKKTFDIPSEYAPNIDYPSEGCLGATAPFFITESGGSIATPNHHTLAVGTSSNYEGDYRIYTRSMYWEVQDVTNFYLNGSLNINGHPVVATYNSYQIDLYDNIFPNPERIYNVVATIPYRTPAGQIHELKLNFSSNGDYIGSQNFEYCTAATCPGCPGGTFLIVMTLTEDELDTP